MEKTMMFDRGGVQLFFSAEGYYTGSNILGNPTERDWERINSIIELVMALAKARVATVDTTHVNKQAHGIVKMKCENCECLSTDCAIECRKK